MPIPPPLNPEIVALATSMEAFEASESVANTGTGARREGEDFERLTARLWLSFRRVAEVGGAQVSVVAGVGTHRYAKLSIGTRSKFVLISASDGVTNSNAEQSRWLEAVFDVNDPAVAFPTESEAVRKYAPESGPLTGAQFPTIYGRLVADAGILAHYRGGA